MPRPLTISLAFLFAALQVAALFHGAQFAFAQHDHAAHTLEAAGVPTPVSHGSGNEGEPEREGGGAPCETLLFCEKLDKLAGATVPVQWGPSARPLHGYATAGHLPETGVSGAFPRGPPPVLHS